MAGIDAQKGGEDTSFREQIEMPESLIRQIKIMISSTRADLSQYREEASKVIAKVAAEKEKQVQLVEISMEKETQSGNREFAVAVSKRWVEESDWVVIIVGWNYGTISDEPGADGLGITEWEYRHASKLDKQLFVFIAGKPDTAERYRASEEEKEDLKDWSFKQTPEQKEKLEKFKNELSKAHISMFANLQVFRELLEKTLKNKIDDLRPDIQPGTPLAELILAVLPEIHDCIRKVALIADCKRIHDYLHELRQNVIRPLREEVLSVWQEDGMLSIARERVILRCMTRRSEAVGSIRAALSAIGSNQQGLRNSIEDLLQLPPLWNNESESLESQPSREKFTEDVNESALKVEEAFSEADRSMANEESNLRVRYVELLEDLRRTRQQDKLGPTDQQRLDDEMEKVEDNRKSVMGALTRHHSWQEAHDKLVEIDSFRELDHIFEQKLNHYCGSPRTNLLSLVNDELKQAESHETGVGSTGDPFVADLRHLKESLDALGQVDGVAAFDQMRKFFDDAFYYVDKRTLNEVERAQERAIRLGDWLDGLAIAQKKTT